MFLEIYTTTLKQDNDFVFQHTHFIDGVQIETKRYGFIIDPFLSDTAGYEQILSDDELRFYFADVCNVGCAINDIVERDGKFKVKKKHSYLPEHLRLKFNVPKQWIEYVNGDKRFAAVYTDNENTYRHIRLFCPVPNHYLVRCYNRILHLQANHYIAIRLKGDFNNYD